MQALVVVAHPCDDGFGRAVAESAVTGLTAAGHEVEVIDLYGDRFVAAMTPAEWAAYHGDTPILDELVARYAELVSRSDVLVFAYPTWWSGLPAILKGMLERTMVPGVGFRFDERTGKVRPGLTRVRRIVGVSTYGSPRRVVKLVNDNGRRTLTRTLRLSCGWRVRTTWFALYGMDTSTDSDRRDFLDRVRAGTAAI